VKKIIIGLMGSALFLIALAAFAYPSEAPEGKTGQMSAEQQKFLQETKELRKESHDIRCELQEASQTPNPDKQKIDDLRKELSAIRGEIQAKAKELGVTMGAGNCANQGTGGNCGKNRPLNCSGAKLGSMSR
jgi:hypothetical protein